MENEPLEFDEENSEDDGENSGKNEEDSEVKGVEEEGSVGDAMRIAYESK